MGETTEESKANGSVPATVEVEVPDDKVREVAAKIAAQSGVRYVVETDAPKLGTVADLLAMDDSGWPSTLILPFAGGSIRLPMTVSSAPGVAREEQKATLKFLSRMQKSHQDAKDLDGEQLAEVIEQRSQILADYAGAVFDAGVVMGWDEAVIGLPFGKENFVRLAVRGGTRLDDLFRTPFLAGLLSRFNQVARPRLEAFDSEGEA